MADSSVGLSLLSVISLLSFFIFLLTNKFSHKIKNGALLDKDFEKPQAFHHYPTVRSGGLASFISLGLFFTLYYFLFEKILLDYFILILIMFTLGFFEDLKFSLRAIYRLLMMSLLIYLFIVFFKLEIMSLDLNILNFLMENHTFSSFFILICFLFIVNGANLIDGFNGLLTIHLLIINFILLYINLNNENQDLAMVITAQIVVLVSFLLFNFPKATMFMGDSGSYLFGSLVAYNIINTNNLNPQISSFFFCIILFYLFFEVFFSFFRKLYFKRSPLKPDRSHLHMLTYGFLHNSFRFKDSNYLNSLLINTIYTSLILPAIFFKDNGLICKYWFFSLLILYIILYSLLYSFGKKQ
tara:strand:+ start:1940 stop:3004 length:1065 start_codon:yes stop_codon:yes gene_type:complete